MDGSVPERSLRTPARQRGGVRRLSAVLLLTVAVGLPARLSAQQVTGRVTDRASGAPVSEAAVTVFDVDGVILKRVLTDKEGRYRLDVTPGDRFRLAFDKLGYEQTMSRRIVVQDDEVMELNVDFASSTIELEPLVVTADRLEEWVRLTTGSHPAALSGRVIGAEELQELTVPGRVLVDLLRYAGLPGAFIHLNGSGLCVAARGAGCATLRLNDLPIDADRLAYLPADEIGAIVYLRSIDAATFRPNTYERMTRRGAGSLWVFTRDYFPFGLHPSQ